MGSFIDTTAYTTQKGIHMNMKTTQRPRPQYRSFRKLEEEFDIVRIKHDGTVENIGLNEKGIRTTKTSANREEVEIILRIPLPTIKEGDLISISQKEKSTTSPSKQWEIQRIESVGNHYKQTLHATKSNNN